MNATVLCFEFNIWYSFVFLFLIFIYLFGCTGSLLWHAGSLVVDNSFLTRVCVSQFIGEIIVFSTDGAGIIEYPHAKI